MKKSVKWLIVWSVLLAVGSAASAVYQIFCFWQYGQVPVHPPYSIFQMILLFVYLPLILIPTVCAAHYFSVKEKVKPIRIITGIILFQHFIVLIGAVVDQFRAFF